MGLVKIFKGSAAYLERLETLAEEPQQVEQVVREIIARVRREGDTAVLDYTARFDGVELESLRVDEAELDRAVAYLDPAVKDIWIQAIENIEQFHLRQKEDSRLEFLPDGSILGWKVTPIDKVGIYIPGGSAVYPSSLFMNVIPARIAGVPRIVVTSPPGKEGRPHKDILAAAALLDLREIYAVGGAQGVAALAYGTETVPRVYKITGPGNQYVAEAKRQISGEVGIDSLAGPSEIVILCDQELEVEYLVRDLLSQAEHDSQARSLLITTLPEQAEAVRSRLEQLIPELPRRDIIIGSFERASGIVVVKEIDEGIGLVNDFAPEHLEILTGEPFTMLSRIRNAGAIFLGPYTPEPVGDYYAGPNHTIPTGGRAKFSSPLSVQDFTKKSSVIGYSRERLEREGEAIRKFAEREELFAHAEAIRVRTEKVEN